MENDAEYQKHRKVINGEVVFLPPNASMGGEPLSHSYDEPNRLPYNLNKMVEEEEVRMKNYTEMVADFHRANGAVIAGKNNGPEVAALRIGLITEELAETLAAMREQNVIEAADGLADLLYVIAGTAVSYGSILDKMPQPLLGPAESFEAKDMATFARRVLPCLASLASALTYAPDVSPAILALWHEVAQDAVRFWGFPMDKLFREVHRSNMTKTFAPAENHAGGKYGAVNPKGPGYEPPDVVRTLARAKAAFSKGA